MMTFLKRFVKRLEDEVTVSREDKGINVFKKTSHEFGVPKKFICFTKQSMYLEDELMVKKRKRKWELLTRECSIRTLTLRVSRLLKNSFLQHDIEVDITAN